VNNTPANAQIADYMARLRTALQDIWAPRRDQIIADVEDHIAAALDEMKDPTPADIANLLERIGDPEQIAAAALSDDPGLAPPSAARPGQGPGWVAPVTSGLAIASLVLSILWLAGLGSLLAIILGFLSLSQIRRSNGRTGGRGLAIAGLIIGTVGVLMPLAWLLLLRPAVSNSATSSAGSAVNGQAAAAQAAAEQAEAAQKAAAAATAAMAVPHCTRGYHLAVRDGLVSHGRWPLVARYQFVTLKPESSSSYGNLLNGRADGTSARVFTGAQSIGGHWHFVGTLPVPAPNAQNVGSNAVIQFTGHYQSGTLYLVEITFRTTAVTSRTFSICGLLMTEGVSSAVTTTAASS
jgi:hypothetical protein